MFAEFMTSVMHCLGNFLDKQAIECIHAMLMKKAAVLDEQRPLLKAIPSSVWNRLSPLWTRTVREYVWKLVHKEMRLLKHYVHTFICKRHPRKKKALMLQNQILSNMEILTSNFCNNNVMILNYTITYCFAYFLFLLNSCIIREMFNIYFDHHYSLYGFTYLLGIIWILNFIIIFFCFIYCCCCCFFQGFY